jgi:hypothetical protein
MIPRHGSLLGKLRTPSSVAPMLITNAPERLTMMRLSEMEQHAETIEERERQRLVKAAAARRLDVGWEAVATVVTMREYDCTERLKVPGGWLYRVIMRGMVDGMNTVFVPDGE